MEEIDNYSEYTKVLENRVSWKLWESHRISYKVIEHEIKLDRSIPEEYK